MSLYNIMAETALLDATLDAFPSIEVTDRFDACDINVEVPTDAEDAFIDWCEDNNIHFVYVA